MSTCPECQADLGANAKFCQECGSEIGADQSEVLGANQQYCPSCGEVISAEAGACPACGYGFTNNDFNDVLWIGGGILSIIIGFIVLAILFGPIAMGMGYKVYLERKDWVGPVIILGGVIDLVLWAWWYLNLLGLY